MTKLYLVRHAESVANTFGIYQGQSYDTDLSDLGRKQAKALVNFFKKVDLGVIYTSPLKRAKQTALALANELGVEVRVDVNLIETNHGEWEGLSKEEIKTKYSDIYKAWLTKPSEVVFPGGEAFVETVARAEAFLNSTIFDEDSIVVTHDNIVRAFLAIILEEDIDRIWNYKIEPASVTMIGVDYLRSLNPYKVLQVNEKKHLKGLMADISVHAL
jgi:broad specificity phosphatase PhoE